MKGQILDFSLQNGGVISGEDGKRYSFAASEWKEQNLPPRGQSVDFDIDENGNAVGVYRAMPAKNSAAAFANTGNAAAQLGDDAGFVEYAVHAFKNNYANFNGRARRKEFWSFQLVVVLPIAALMIIGLAARSAAFYYLGYLLALAAAIPGLAVGARRLHDTGKSGWLQLIQYLPVVGLILIVFYAQEGVRGDNQYGSDPKA